MDGSGVDIIGKLGAAAAAVKPYVIEGPGFKKLAYPFREADDSTEWHFDDLPHTKPGPEPVNLRTLTGLADFVTANRDGRPLEECMVAVIDHTKVAFTSKMSEGPLPQRDVYAIAHFEDLIKTAAPGLMNAGTAFSFGSWMDPESFNVALQTLFIQNADRDRVLQIVGNVRTEGVETFDDDGVTQGVIMSAGVKLGKMVGVPNPVTLAPWRTFREVDQPESKFVLRARGSAGEMPRLALFEADGGAWKLEAITAIAAFLRPRVPTDVVIVA